MTKLQNVEKNDFDFSNKNKVKNHDNLTNYLCMRFVSIAFLTSVAFFTYSHQNKKFVSPPVSVSQMQPVSMDVLEYDNNVIEIGNVDIDLSDVTTITSVFNYNSKIEDKNYGSENNIGFRDSIKKIDFDGLFLSEESDLNISTNVVSITMDKKLATDKTTFNDFFVTVKKDIDYKTENKKNSVSFKKFQFYSVRIDSNDIVSVTFAETDKNDFISIKKNDTNKIEVTTTNITDGFN